MASLQEIFNELKEKVKESGKPANRVLKIKGLKRLVIQLNAVPDGDSVRFSMTIHSSRNFKKQLGIVADDAQDFETIANFLTKYKDYLSKYIKFNIQDRSNVEDIEDTEETEKQQPKQNKSKKERNVEDEF
ncbi:hypothetical protein ARV3_gp09 [Acidianus rod-shaped virus 3]|uniref:PHA01746-like domain-containing protein n=1 Tax=Acidianus rod-shaped virus 3 TaxID=2730617 RepID=A0A6M3VYK6_9VIRU|nr:hypothetical protein QIT28_gp09 [Acidianus rod-shaped virus 3]QJF12322.1 hypothetical protein ARV3_gp09 [Acidianus rod-shaped virus 3]